jgi:hypothetical protein
MEKKEYFNESFLLTASQFDYENYSGNSQNWNQPKQINIQYKYYHQK